MKQSKIKVDNPGVYLFKRGREILYVGKATSLKARVRSYFGAGLSLTRSSWIAKMVEEATRVDYIVTDSVLEALILEASLIKKYQPKYNAREKDDKSYLYVVITEEDFPRVLVQRGNGDYGPFPHSAELKAALKIIRKIFPFRDSCKPNQGKPCFNAQIGLCPGVCSGAITKIDYARTIRHLKLFFSGRKSQLLKQLTREMKRLAKAQKFEQAGEIKKQIFALQHIQDVALIKRDSNQPSGLVKFRIEAYDIAHLSGKNTVGAMVVSVGGELEKNAYRKFKLKGISSQKSDDINNLKEIITRRFNHPEWSLPNLILVDGGQAQVNVARAVLASRKLAIPVLGVVKDERHKARAVLGDRKLAERHKSIILRLNQEAHRFAISYHRKLRRRMV